MNIRKPLLREHRVAILENVKQAKQYIQTGKLSEDDLKTLIEIDPTPTRKFVGWMAKQWIAKTVTDINRLRNTIEEFNVFLGKGKTSVKDINQYKSFEDLYKEVDTLNNTGSGLSNKDLESDYETVVDNEDLLIVVPHTHEASRKLGLTHFAYRDCEDGDGKDSAWCTTYKAPNHFNDYYYKNNVTFYYIKVKSEKLRRQIEETIPGGEAMVVTALAILDDGQIDGYDGNDNQIDSEDITTFKDIIGIG
jgi:hypothetical protein